VNALYSYFVLFSEKEQAEIKQEVTNDFLVYVEGRQNETEVNAMFMHPGFSHLVTALNNQELTDLQFRLFSRYHLDDKTTAGRRVAVVQKSLPLNEDQKAEVLDYLKAIKSENDQVETKQNNKATVWIIIAVALLIIRIILRMSR
jgi:hypothetical protein